MENTNSPHEKGRNSAGMIRRGNVIFTDFGTKRKQAVIPDMATVIRYVQEKIVAAGHNANDSIFWKCAEHAPVTSRKAKSNTLDTQIGWALAQTNRFYSNLRQERRAAQ